MTSDTPQPVLNPLQMLTRYNEELELTTAGIIGTVFFERGSKPEVRQGILACFDRFETLFGQHLKGGKSTDMGKFSKKTASGLQAIRDAIVKTAPHMTVSVAQSSATDQDTAAE